MPVAAHGYSDRESARDSSSPSPALHTRMDSQLLQALKTALAPAAVLHRPEELMLYEYDGPVEIARPTCVVFPRSTADVLAIVKLANQYQTPLVGRRAGPQRRHPPSFFAHESHSGN